MNKVILTGRVCAAPEAYTTQSGITRSSFRIAVQRPFKNPDGNYDADFLPIIAWRQTAEFCNKYLDKGRMIDVEGNVVKLLCESVLLPEEIDENAERREAEKAAQAMRGKQSYKDYMLSQLIFARAVNNLRVKKHDSADINHK